MSGCCIIKEWLIANTGQWRWSTDPMFEKAAQKTARLKAVLKSMT
jgi:hypothetical protein